MNVTFVMRANWPSYLLACSASGPNPSINTDAGDEAARAGYVKR